MVPTLKLLKEAKRRTLAFRRLSSSVSASGRPSDNKIPNTSGSLAPGTNRLIGKYLAQELLAAFAGGLLSALFVTRVVALVNGMFEM